MLLAGSARAEYTHDGFSGIRPTPSVRCWSVTPPRSHATSTLIFQSRNERGGANGKQGTNAASTNLRVVSPGAARQCELPAARDLRAGGDLERFRSPCAAGPSCDSRLLLDEFILSCIQLFCCCLCCLAYRPCLPLYSSLVGPSFHWKATIRTILLALVLNHEISGNILVSKFLIY